MSAQLELVIKARSDYDTAFKALQKNLQETGAGSRKLGGDTDTATGKTAKFADSIGKMSTTLARSADSLGLPAGPFRTMNDLMDVAELGFSNVGKSAVGFNASTLGAAAAAGAAGYAVGTLIRDLTGLGGWLDKTAVGMTGLAKVEAEVAESNRRALAIREANIGAFLRNGAAVEDLARRNQKLKDDQETLAKATALLGFEVKDVVAAQRALDAAQASTEAGQKKLTEQHKKAAEAAAKQATDLRKLNFVLEGQTFELEQANKGLELYLSTWIDFKPIDLARDIEELNRALGQGPEMDPDIILGPIRRAKLELNQMAPSFGGALKDGFKVGLEGLGGVILGAIQGGGDIAKSVGAKIFGDVGSKLGDELGKSIGGTLGSTIGSFLGPIGTLVGGWLGGLFGKAASWFGSLFGGKSDVSKARDAFFGQWEGGFVGVQRALIDTVGEVGQQDFVKMLFDAKSMEELQRVIALIKETIASVGQNVPPVYIPVSYGDPGAYGGGGGSAEGMARGGIVLPFVPRAAQGIVTARPGGSPVIVGEGGQAELVAPVRALAREIGAAAAAAAGGGGGRGEAAIILDGEVVGRWFMRRNRAGLLPVMAR